MEEPPILTVEKINPFSRGEGDLDEEERTDLHYSVGMIVMFLMFTIMGSAGVVLKEKKLNTWTRVLSVPTETNLFLTGRMMGSFIIGWLADNNHARIRPIRPEHQLRQFSVPLLPNPYCIYVQYFRIGYFSG